MKILCSQKQLHERDRSLMNINCYLHLSGWFIASIAAQMPCCSRWRRSVSHCPTVLPASWSHLAAHIQVCNRATRRSNWQFEVWTVSDEGILWKCHYKLPVLFVNFYGPCSELLKSNRKRFSTAVSSLSTATFTDMQANGIQDMLRYAKPARPSKVKNCQIIFLWLLGRAFSDGITVVGITTASFHAHHLFGQHLLNARPAKAVMEMHFNDWVYRDELDPTD